VYCHRHLMKSMAGSAWLSQIVHKNGIVDRNDEDKLISKWHAGVGRAARYQKTWFTSICFFNSPAPQDLPVTDDFNLATDAILNCI